MRLLKLSLAQWYPGAAEITELNRNVPDLGLINAPFFYLDPRHLRCRLYYCTLGSSNSIIRAGNLCRWSRRSCEFSSLWLSLLKLLNGQPDSCGQRVRHPIDILLPLYTANWAYCSSRNCSSIGSLSEMSICGVLTWTPASSVYDWRHICTRTAEAQRFVLTLWWWYYGRCQWTSKNILAIWCPKNQETRHYSRMEELGTGYLRDLNTWRCGGRA